MTKAVGACYDRFVMVRTDMDMKNFIPRSVEKRVDRDFARFAAQNKIA